MNVHYVDPSAWVKLYSPEPGSERMTRLFEGDNALACSSLGLIETLSTLARGARSGRITGRDFARVTRTVDQDFEDFSRIDLTSDVVEIARTLPSVYALRGADTVHLASAMWLRTLLANDDEVVFVTSDEGLATAARMARFRVVDPRTESAGGTDD